MSFCNLKGAPVAEAISERLRARVEALKEKGVSPRLAIIRVGERPQDIAYENGAARRCAKIGVDITKFLLDENCTREELLGAIQTVNNSHDIHGCLIFRPLPDRPDENLESEAAELLDARKDVDGFTRAAIFEPCAPVSVMELLAHYGISLRGKNVIIIGRSAVVGRPLARLMLEADATVTICHTKTRNMPELCRNADIIVGAAGRVGLITPEYVTDKSIVIDIAVNTGPDGRLCGDVDFAKVAPIVSAITPVPGGVGAITTSVLAKHVIEAAELGVSG